MNSRLSRLYDSKFDGNINDDVFKTLAFVASNYILLDSTLCPTYRKPFEIIAKGLSRAVKLPLLDEFRNFLLTEHVDYQAEQRFAEEQIASSLRRPIVKKYEIELPIPRMPIR